MAGERYAELAVEALRDAINSGIAAQLAAVETAQGLTPNTIARPVAVTRSRAAARDNRSPLIAVYWERFTLPSQRRGVVAVDCTVVVQIVGRNAASTEGLEEDHGRYCTAIVDLIRDDPHLGGRVVASLVTDGEADASIGDNSTTRLVSAIGVEVRIDNP